MKINVSPGGKKCKVKMRIFLVLHKWLIFNFTIYLKAPTPFTMFQTSNIWKWNHPFFGNFFFWGWSLQSQHTAGCKCCKWLFSLLQEASSHSCKCTNPKGQRHEGDIHLVKKMVVLWNFQEDIYLCGGFSLGHLVVKGRHGECWGTHHTRDWSHHFGRLQ